MGEKGATLDLTNCDREQIHIPGAIQPHGFLLALEVQALSLRYASENVAQLVGRPLTELLGRPLAEVLGRGADATLRPALEHGQWERVNPIAIEVAGRLFDAIVHAHAGLIVIELEPARVEAAAASDRHLPLRLALPAVQSSRTLDELATCVVDEVRRITGFERVMFYRFDEAGHGSVDAESKAPELESYLGLHYPASDIPRQARELYRKNWLRIIPDARYSPVRIFSAGSPGTDAPLDLSFSVLRSVSPIHLEYLANMGVRASMSVSLVVHDRLWGLISCISHSRPCFVSFELRSACEVLGRLTSLQIKALEDSRSSLARSSRRGELENMAVAMRSSDNVLKALLATPDALLALVGAQGVAGVDADEVTARGRAPAAEQVLRLSRWLDERGEETVVALSSLTRAGYPGAEELNEVCCGVLSWRLPGTLSRRLLWFRPEVVQTVNWGGDPRKPVEPEPGNRLHPRRSFDLWKEEVRMQAFPWREHERDAAAELRQRTVELDLEKRLTREQHAVQARDDVVAIVSHDLRSPLNVIRLQASLILSTLPDDERSARLRVSTERIHRSVDRMDALIHDLLDSAKIEAGRFAVEPEPEPVSELIEQTLILVRPIAEARRIELREEVVGSPVASVDRERIFQVLSNLIGNALKFTPEGGRVSVSARSRGNEVLFSITDTGPGIPSANLDHLFNRYWQARSSEHAGAGLGLYIARGIVEAHGGRIWVESRVGEGSSFQFTVPRAQSQHV